MKKLLLAFSLLMVTQILPAQSWTLDRTHSSLNFQVRHILTPMMGKFKTFEVELKFDPKDLPNSNISTTIETASVDMGSERLNNHLKGEDFFDVEQYPTITFISKSIAADGKDPKTKKAKYLASGTLTFRGVSKEVRMPFTYMGSKKTKFGTKAGFYATLTIDRKDYGLEYNYEDYVGEQVIITAFLEMNGSE